MVVGEGIAVGGSGEGKAARAAGIGSVSGEAIGASVHFVVNVGLVQTNFVILRKV